MKWQDKNSNTLYIRSFMYTPRFDNNTREHLTAWQMFNQHFHILDLNNVSVYLSDRRGFTDVTNKRKKRIKQRE